MRFGLVGLALLASLSVAAPAAHAVPNFGDGWVDQGGKWHAFFPNGANGSGGQGAASSGSSGDAGQEQGDNSGNGGTSNTPTGGDTNASGNPDDRHEDEESGTPDGSGSNDLTAFTDFPLNDPIIPGGSGSNPKSSGGAQGPGNGGPQDGVGGSTVVLDGPSRAAVPEPSSIALLAGALVAAGAARRRKQAK